MVQMIIGRDWLPVRSTTFRSRPKPRRITASCNTFLEVKVMPVFRFPEGVHTSARSIPMIMAITGPPITGNYLPISQEGTAISRQINMPGRFCFIVFMVILSPLISLM